MLNGYVNGIIKFVIKLGYFCIGVVWLLLILFKNFFGFVLGRFSVTKLGFLKFSDVLRIYFLRKARRFFLCVAKGFSQSLIAVGKIFSLLTAFIAFYFKSAVPHVKDIF